MQVLAQVVDAVVVLHGEFTVHLDQFVAGAQAVLHDEQRLLPAVPVLVEDHAQTGRVDLPTPFAGGQGRVRHAAEDVAFAALAACRVAGRAGGHVVAERHEIHGVLQILAVLLGDVQLHALFTQGTQEVAGVCAAHVHVTEREVRLFRLHGGEYVGGVGGERVGGHGKNHAADLRTGCQLACRGGGACGCDQLVVHRLVQVGVAELVRRGVDAAGHERQVQHGVDFVEGQPVLHALAVAGEHGAGVAFVEADEFAAGPAVVLLDQMQRGFVVAEGDEWFHAVLFEFVQHTVVEGEARLVRGFFVAAGEDARPGDGEAEDLEAHLREQGDVFAVAVVEVDALQFEVVLGGFGGARVQAACGQHILQAGALAVFVPGAFELVGGGGASEEETVGERAERLRLGQRRGSVGQRGGLGGDVLVLMHGVLQGVWVFLLP